jgi:hypothetical protein
MNFYENNVKSSSIEIISAKFQDISQQPMQITRCSCAKNRRLSVQFFCFSNNRFVVALLKAMDCVIERNGTGLVSQSRQSYF